MLDSQTITWILVAVFTMRYGVRISKLCVKKENRNAKAKNIIIFIITLAFSVLLVTSMPIGMRATGRTLTEILMHHHPNATILKKFEYDKYGIVYYAKSSHKKPRFAYYINDDGWRLANKYYYDCSFDDFSIEEESETGKILITFNMLKDRSQTFIYLNYDGLDGKTVSAGKDIIHDSLFTSFERIPSKTGATYVGVINQIVDKNYVITFNGKNYKF